MTEIFSRGVPGDSAQARNTSLPKQENPAERNALPDFPCNKEGYRIKWNLSVGIFPVAAQVHQALILGLGLLLRLDEELLGPLGEGQLEG